MSWVLFIIFGSVVANKRELGEEPDYYPKVNPNPNNIEELTVQDIPMYFDMFNRFYEIDYKDGDHLNKSFEKFTDNVKRITIMNKFTTAAKFAINEFSHLTLEEFTDKYTGFNDTGMNVSDASPFTYNNTAETPENLDWRVLGIPALARHQGPCKSSYVFSAIANIESQMAKTFKVTIRLSEQQAYECEKDGSCKYGGLPHKVMEALLDIGGVEEQIDYIYDPQDQRECKAKKDLMAVKIKTVQCFMPTYENSLIALLAMYGPVVTTIYVSEAVKNYHKGVLWPTDCDKKPNHAVLLVGYGITADSVPFWIIKNSWGMLWGESGYIRLIRGERACNIGQYVATTTVEPINKDKLAVRTRDELPQSGFLNNVAGAFVSLLPTPIIQSPTEQSSTDTNTTTKVNTLVTEKSRPRSEEVDSTESPTTKVSNKIVLYKAEKEKNNDTSHSASKGDDDEKHTETKPIARNLPEQSSGSSYSSSSSSSEWHKESSKKVKIYHASLKEKEKKENSEEDKSDSGSFDSDDVAYTKPILRITQF